MAMLSHDPRIKQELRNSLYQYLYGPLEEYYTKKINSIIHENTRLGDYDHPHFIYKGEVYSVLPDRLPLKKNPLDKSLVSDMEDYLFEVNKVRKEEIPLTMGYITAVLNASSHFKDYFNLLPSVIHAPLQEWVQSCPCNTGVLDSEKINEMLNQKSKMYNLIKTRRLLNTLLPR